MQIDKIMHRNVKIIGPDETLRDAATAMKKLDVGCCRSASTTSWSE